LRIISDIVTFGFMNKQLYLLSILFVLFSCAHQFSDENLSIFKYNEVSGINSLDPAFAKDQASIWACSQLFNGLVQLDDSLLVKPSIAKSWHVDDDGKRYVFTLRDDVLFHENQFFKNFSQRQVSAYDFEYSFARLIDPKLASPGAWVMSNVKAFEAKNDSIFILELYKSFPPFLGLLSMPYCSVVPQEIIEQNVFHENPVGTGPFRFQYWKQNVKLVYRKNIDYFEKGLPYLDAVAITFIKDKQTAFLEFLKGNLDFISGIDASYKDELLDKEGRLQKKYSDKIKFYSLPYLNTEYLGFLMDSSNVSLSSQLKIRRAINYGFDRKKMIRFLRNNVGTPATKGFIPLGLPSFSESLNGYNYNPELARKLIQECELSQDHKIVLSTTSSYLDICEFIQNQLGLLGLNMEVTINPPSTHRQMVATSKLNFFRGSWIADYGDGENYLALFYSKNYSPNGPNYTHFASKEYDRLYEESLVEKSIVERHALYNKMDQIIIDNAAIVPLYYDRVLRFVQNDIVGFQGNAMNMLNLKSVSRSSQKIPK
jgi:peptide/nickel transport system substrate-binding protein